MDFNEPKLNYHGGDWQEMERWLREELDTIYKRLADLHATEATTQQLRGQASIISRMLDFPFHAAQNAAL
jgi:hypothetical protein